jgi:branched-chain amino acid transport system permease protein
MSMDGWLLFEITLAGIGTGGLYALTGLAFVLIYKSTKVVNLAIGEMLMVSAYIFFALSAGMGLPVWVAIPGALLVSAVFGALVERSIIRPMLGESPISSFMVTVGLSSILVGLVELIWTADQQRLPEFLPNKHIEIGQAFVSPKIFYGFWIAVLLITAVLLLFRFWRGGVALRATATDQAAAYSVGINVPRVFSLTWMAAAVIAGVAGIVVGSIGGVSSAMGVFGLSVLVVVIFGGLDSALGALVGGMIVGIVEALAGFYIGGEYKLLATFSLLVLALLVRPYGLFGTHEVERL